MSDAKKPALTPLDDAAAALRVTVTRTPVGVEVTFSPSARNAIIAIPTLSQGYTGRAK